MSTALTPDAAFPVAEINQAFLLGVLKIDEVIADRTKKIQHSFWRSMFPRGEFPYGHGIVERVQQFEGPLPDQGDLTGWVDMVIDTKVDAQGNVTADPCNQSPNETMKIGFTTRTYTGKQRAFKTDWICLNEIKWKWQFEQQLALTFEGLADYTLSVWDNHAQKSFMALSKQYALTPGLFADKVTYDPFSASTITVPTATLAKTMLPTTRILEQIHQYYALQAERYALGGESGAPVFGLISHPDDIRQMCLREGPVFMAWLYSKPELIIEGYGKTKELMNFGIMYDMKLPRFKISSTSGTNTILTPVLPYLNEPTTVGEAVIANPAYVKAEYSIMGICLKEMFSILVPPFNPTSPGGGTQFNNKPSFNGEFQWRNIITNNSENFWGEKGRYVARCQAFNKPGAAVRDMAWFLVQRDTGVPLVYPLGGTTSGFTMAQPFNAPTAASSGTVVDIVAVDADPATGLYTKAIVTLSAKLTSGLGASVTVTFMNSATTTATISGAFGANQYKYELMFGSSANWAIGGIPGTPTNIIGGTVAV